MARSTTLQMERLEERTVPAVFGVPWSDPNHLTISFVPDGTSVDGVASTLYSSMQAANATAWQAEILRAVQTWAQYANINVNVVADDGEALGVDGATQGDPRFGDIRIAARPLSGNVLAITTPSGPLGGTRAGDIVLNSNILFSIGGAAGTYDLYSAVLQEVGHALGMSNSTDPASPMFEMYSGVRTGLTDGDIYNIRSLYGTRAQDVFETGRSSLPFEVKAPTGSPANASPVILADLTTPQDVDTYKFLTPLKGSNTLTVQLDASSSLLAARLTVYDDRGNIVGTSVGTPQGNVLQVNVFNVRHGVYYTVRVDSVDPTFSVGSYQLKFVTDPNAPDVMAYGSSTVLNDAHTDDTPDTATRLNTAAGYASKTHYSTLARIVDATDVDVYRIDTPTASTNQQLVLTINVRALDPTALDPVVQVFDRNGQAVDFQVLNDGNGTMTVQIVNAAKNSRYYVQVGSEGDGQTGDYQLDADIRTQAVNLQSLAEGNLSAASAVDYQTLTTGRSQVMYFELTAAGLSGDVTGGVRMAIFDSAGHVVTSLFALAGQTVSTSTFLAAGKYTVRFEALAPDSVKLQPMTYGLKGVTLTDPIATASSDPTLSPLSPDFTLSKSTTLTASAGMLDLLGDVIW